MGAGRQQACTECTKKCLKIHGKNKTPFPTTQSFFKIMIGNFQDALFIPPHFAPKLEKLVNQSIYLEDLNGQRWKVEVSIVDDSLAFQQGWREFVFDHSVSTGEFVIFSNITGSDFIVQIFGVSGCERFSFPKIADCNGNKRKRKVKESVADPMSLGEDHEDGDVQVCAIGESPAKKERASQTSKHGSSGPMLIESKDAAEGVNEDPCTPKKSPRQEKSYGKLRPAAAMHLKAPSSMIAEDPHKKMRTNEDDCIVVPQLNSSCCSNSSAENLTASQVGQHNREEIDHLIMSPKEDFIEEHVRTPDCSGEPGSMNKRGTVTGQGANEIQATVSIAPESTQTKLYDEDTDKQKGNCDNDCKYVAKERTKVTVAKGNSIECSGEEVNESEEDIHNIFSEDLMCELGSLETTPSDHYGIEKDNGDFGVGKTVIKENSSHYGSSKEPCTAFKFECTEENFNTISFGGANSKGPHVDERQFVFLGSNLAPVKIEVEDVPCGESSPKKVKKVPGIHESPIMVDIKPLQAGIKLDAELEEDEKPNICFDENSCQAATSEDMDSVGLTSPNSSDFFLSIAVDTQFWLELREKLPPKVGKRKNDRMVVLLRDPDMRIWPVVYHDSIRFVGFHGGWKAFVTANDIRKGDTCNFELSEDSELHDSVFQVQISRSVEASS